jgi:hypothetical protein
MLRAVRLRCAWHGRAKQLTIGYYEPGEAEEDWGRSAGDDRPLAPASCGEPRWPEGQDDFDVIGPDGLVIGRIFKAATSPRLELERSLFCYFVDICAVRFVWGLDRLRL